jgi:hypothetical protein
LCNDRFLYFFPCLVPQIQEGLQITSLFFHFEYDTGHFCTILPSVLGRELFLLKGENCSSMDQSLQDPSRNFVSSSSNPQHSPSQGNTTYPYYR